MPRRRTTIPELEIEYFQGIHLVDTVLWFDAPRPTDLCFVSHAHLDQNVAHRKILATEATAVLLGQRKGKGRALLSPFHRPFTLGDLDLELFPAGHILGSAQIRVERGKSRLVYTGDFTLEHSRTAEQASILEADVLVMEATNGLPHQVFPPREEVEPQILGWTEDRLRAGEQPVFFASPLGKAQELARLFSDHGIPVRAHRTIFDNCRKYRELGLDIPGVRNYRARPPLGEVILLPPQLQGSKTLAMLAPARTAVVSAAALESELTSRYQVDAAFPLSGHADHPALLRYVKESGAKKVFLVGRHARALASELRQLGHMAWALRPPEQMDLFGTRLTGASS